MEGLIAHGVNPFSVFDIADVSFVDFSHQIQHGSMTDFEHSNALLQDPYLSNIEADASFFPFLSKMASKNTLNHAKFFSTGVPKLICDFLVQYSEKFPLGDAKLLSNRKISIFLFWHMVSPKPGLSYIYHLRKFQQSLLCEFAQNHPKCQLLDIACGMGDDILASIMD